MTPDLNEIVLEGALQHLPNLTALAVIGCHKIDHITLLRLLYNTPMIESLGFTVMVGANDANSRNVAHILI